MTMYGTANMRNYSVRYSVRDANGFLACGPFGAILMFKPLTERIQYDMKCGMTWLNTVGMRRRKQSLTP